MARIAIYRPRLSLISLNVVLFSMFFLPFDIFYRDDMLVFLRVDSAVLYVNNRSAIAVSAWLWVMMTTVIPLFLLVS